MSEIEDFGLGLGIDPELVKQFEGLWVKVRLSGSSKQTLAFFKKAGERGALFVSPTKQAPFAVLYDDIEEISTYTGALNLPEGTKWALNGKLIEAEPDAKNKV